jgi:hypothetical protein
MNNPSRYIDPSGHMAIEDEGSGRGCRGRLCSLSTADYDKRRRRSQSQTHTPPSRGFTVTAPVSISNFQALPTPPDYRTATPSLLPVAPPTNTPTLPYQTPLILATQTPPMPAGWTPVADLECQGSVCEVYDELSPSFLPSKRIPPGWGVDPYQTAIDLMKTTSPAASELIRQTEKALVHALTFLAKPVIVIMPSRPYYNNPYYAIG